MTCSGCGNKSAVRTASVVVSGRVSECCESCGGLGLGLKRESKTGFMYKDSLLKKRSSLKMARAVRHEYRGDDTDEVAGRSS